MTSTPRATASLMAPVTLPASEQEISTADAPSLTACAIRCAWTCPSSVGGVIHAISTGTPCSVDSSFAAASAPVRADKNTGFVELLAITAIFRPRGLAGPPPVSGADEPHAAASAAITAKVSVDLMVRIVVS